MAGKKKRRPPPEVCPVCGEDVPRNASACQECGSDYESGWSDDTSNYGSLDLPDDQFDYDEFVKSEFGNSPRPRGLKPIWWVTAIVILIVFVLVFVIR